MVRTRSVAAVVLLMPLLALAQAEQPESEVLPDPPTEATGSAEEQAPTPPTTAAEPEEEKKKEGRHEARCDHRGCSKHARGEHAEKKGHHDGCPGGAHGHHAEKKGHHGGHHWGSSDPWRIAAEGGSVFGLGLAAQLSYRPRPGFAVGVGAIGFGDRGLERRHDRGGRDGRWARTDVDVEQGYFLSVTRYRGARRGGFFAGAKLGAALAEFTDRDGNEDRMWGAFLSPEVGYQWFPFQRSLFIRPSVGANLVFARWNGTASAPVPPFIAPSASLTLGLAR